MNIQKIIYTAGLVLDKTKLINYVSKKYPNIFCHHMTIQYGNLNRLPDNLGQEFNFIAESLVYDDKAIAIAGYPNDQLIENHMLAINQTPHITLCTAEGIKPVYSNTLLTIGKYSPIFFVIPMKVAAFVAYTNNTTGWIFEN